MSALPVMVAIVEDEKELVAILKKYFYVKGIPISFVAYDGETAVKLFRAAAPKPDVILLDYRLPAKDGIAVAREMLAIEPRARIIFLSGDSRVEKEALAAGAALFLKKPSSLQAIINAIDFISNTATRPQAYTWACRRASGRHSRMPADRPYF